MIYWKWLYVSLLLLCIENDCTSVYYYCVSVSILWLSSVERIYSVHVQVTYTTLHSWFQHGIQYDPYLLNPLRNDDNVYKLESPLLLVCLQWYSKFEVMHIQQSERYIYVWLLEKTSTYLHKMYLLYIRISYPVATYVLHKILTLMKCCICDKHFIILFKGISFKVWN